MTDRPYTSPRPRRTPWPLIAGVVVLAVLAGILLALFLTRGSGDRTASGSSTPTPSATASASASGSTSAEPSASATASAAAPGPELAADAIAATTVESLTVRSEPGLDGERLGTLEGGAVSFVAGGPTDADGFRWYLASGLGLPPNSGCAGPAETEPYNCPVWFGWVAAASESGDPWLVEHEIACPQEPYTAEGLAVARTGLERLACFGSEPFTFRGYWPEIPDDAGLGGACVAEAEPSGWLLCQNINYNTIVADESQDMFGIGIRVSIAPESDASMPDRGTWVEVRVHLDDPAAQGCDEAATAGDFGDRPPEQIVLDCRAEAVLEAAQAVEGP